MAIPNGYLLFNGKSNLDGAPIIAVATLKTSNRKTGPMVQTWILARDVAPHTAVQTGADVSVCGACPLRGAVCYVTLHQAPLAVWRAFHRGLYPDLPARCGLAFKRKIRFGAYGDPCAVPLSVWTELAEHSTGWTGYTHQWRLPRMGAFKRFLMASVETARDARIARGRGWRTFRVTHGEQAPGMSETDCPNYTHGTACADCLLCNGTVPDDSRRSITIPVHGQGAPQLGAIVGGL